MPICPQILLKYKYAVVERQQDRCGTVTFQKTEYDNGKIVEKFVNKVEDDKFERFFE